MNLCLVVSLIKNTYLRYLDQRSLLYSWHCNCTNNLGSFAKMFTSKSNIINLAFNFWSGLFRSKRMLRNTCNTWKITISWSFLPLLIHFIFKRVSEIFCKHV